MAHTIPTNEPANLRAGDTATWTKSLGDYPADDGWVLAYELVNAASRITFSANASGSDHLVSVAASTTNAWAAGSYSWKSKVTKGAEVYSIDTGSIDVLPTFASAVDARTHAAKTLAAIEAWIESRDIGVAEYQIAGRQLRIIPIADLLVLRDRYKSEVNSQKNADRINAGLSAKNKLQVRI